MSVLKINSLYKRFGKMIGELRTELGLSQEEVSSRLNLPKSTYGNYERGDRKIPLPDLIALSKFYDFSIDDFINEEKEFHRSSKSSELEEIENKRKAWDTEFGYIDWTPEEIEELKSYARYLLLKRGE